MTFAELQAQEVIVKFGVLLKLLTNWRTISTYKLPSAKNPQGNFISTYNDSAIEGLKFEYIYVYDKTQWFKDYYKLVEVKLSCDGELMLWATTGKTPVDLAPLTQVKVSFPLMNKKAIWKGFDEVLNSMQLQELPKP